MATTDPEKLFAIELLMLKINGICLTYHKNWKGFFLLLIVLCFIINGLIFQLVGIHYCITHIENFSDLIEVIPLLISSLIGFVKAFSFLTFRKDIEKLMNSMIAVSNIGRIHSYNIFE